MKICIDGRMILSSGIGTILQNFILNFSGEFELFIIGNSNQLNQFLKGKSNYSIIESDLRIYSIKEQIKLPVLIPTCDVFWSPHYNIPLLPIKAAKRAVNINDTYHLSQNSATTFIQRLYARILIFLAARLSDIIITISDFSKREILKHTWIKETKIVVNYCGVDTELFRPISKPDKEKFLLKRTDLPKKFILYVGNVKPHKNLTILVQAFILLNESMRDITLVIVGRKDGFLNGDPELFKLVEKQNLLSKVYFTGYLDNESLPYFYSIASLFVFPSLYEGFGLPPLEALACECPVIASNAASIPEVCGNWVTYFNPVSSIDLANKIRDKLNNYEIKKYREEIKATYNWALSYKRQIEIFQNL
ncbi:MAG: glycosyltransferase family 1 protein [Daejeonella sp.]